MQGGHPGSARSARASPAVTGTSTTMSSPSAGIDRVWPDRDRDHCVGPRTRRRSPDRPCRLSRRTWPSPQPGRDGDVPGSPRPAARPAGARRAPPSGSRSSCGSADRPRAAAVPAPGRAPARGPPPRANISANRSEKAPHRSSAPACGVGSAPRRRLRAWLRYQALVRPLMPLGHRSRRGRSARADPCPTADAKAAEISLNRSSALGSPGCRSGCERLARSR